VNWISLDSFPLLNSCLNAASATLLLAGFVFIKTGRYKAHGVSMIAAFCTSSVFLTCYLIYHVQRPPKSLGLPMSTFKVVYFTILISHTILAIVIVPLILVTFWRAYKRLWDKHRKIAVITMPLWFYVSVTGVVIYWMLYHVAPTLR
jgi:uncharacterized membrane protein YozB (DUF420 family)